MMVPVRRAAEDREPDDVELLAVGDEESFARFYRRHVRSLAGYLMRMTHDAEVAADLTAETFAAALAGRGRYRPERGSPRTWLYAIASHKLSDWRGAVTPRIAPAGAWGSPGRR